MRRSKVSVFLLDYSLDDLQSRFRYNAMHCYCPLLITWALRTDVSTYTDL